MVQRIPDYRAVLEALYIHEFIYNLENALCDRNATVMPREASKWRREKCVSRPVGVQEDSLLPAEFACIAYILSLMLPIDSMSQQYTELGIWCM